MNVKFGDERTAVVQRYQPFVAKSKTGSISPKRSLAVPVQFHDFLIAKYRKQTFAVDNLFLTVTVTSAALIAVIQYEC